MGGPIMVAPVEHEGVRYEAVHWGKERDLGQNGGHVAAIDPQSGEEMWIVRIYKIKYGNMSPQKYDRFITSLTLSDDGTALIIEDETGAIHSLKLSNRKVRRIKGPPPYDDSPDPDMPPKQGFWDRLFGREK